jgi:hypothetical protein
MTDPRTAPAAPESTDPPTGSLETTTVARGPSWEAEDAFWQSASPERPYARADRGYEYYRNAYRYGVDAAMRYHDRDWREVEQELRRVWDLHHDSSRASWAEMRDAVRDAWDHVRGESEDDRTHIR